MCGTENNEQRLLQHVSCILYVVVKINTLF